MSGQPNQAPTPAKAAKVKKIVAAVSLTGKGGIIAAGAEVTADMFKGDGAKVIADRLKSGHLVEQ